MPLASLAVVRVRAAHNQAQLVPLEWGDRTVTLGGGRVDLRPACDASTYGRGHCRPTISPRNERLVIVSTPKNHRARIIDVDFGTNQQVLMPVLEVAEHAKINAFASLGVSTSTGNFSPLFAGVRPV
jgi:hypothetical protein